MRSTICFICSFQSNRPCINFMVILEMLEMAKSTLSMRLPCICSSVYDDQLSYFLGSGSGDKSLLLKDRAGNIVLNFLGVSDPNVCTVYLFDLLANSLHPWL